jgi:Flp pilus assembly protein TadG
VRRRTDGGQAAVELALALPLVAVFLFGAVQVVAVARDQIAVVHAARELARAAAVAGDSPLDGSSTVTGITDLEPARLTVAVSMSSSSGRVRAEVRYRSPTDVPFIGALLPDVTVVGTATMAREPRPGVPP